MKNKFNAKRTEYKGIMFDSKKEALFYSNLQDEKINILQDALISIQSGTSPYNEFEAFSFVSTAKSIASKALYDLKTLKPSK